MNIDKQVLFLIIVVGIISAGLVGASVINSDTTMKQEVFDGIKVSVPVDSNFVKTGDGVYKDNTNGITINTFKNNNSMVDFLRNTKNSKVISIENQPPQSVAFKKGDMFNLLVTNGKEGIAIGTKDGRLTSEMGNNVVFSNNHKSVKSPGIGVIHPRMVPKQDFNLIMLLVADVDTNIFNLNVLEQNNINISDEYNLQLEEANIFIDDSSDGEDLSDTVENEGLDGVINDNGADASSSGSHSNSNSDSDTVESISSDDDSDVVDTISSDDASPASDSSSDVVSSPSGSHSSSGSSAGNDGYSLEECQNLVNQFLQNTNYKIHDHRQSGVLYVFDIEDDNGNDLGNITVNSKTGELKDNLIV